MQHQLKRISPAGIPEALKKVELYRYLNEPEEAESICRDILRIEPAHALALRLLGLAITDQFEGGAADRYAEVEKIFRSLPDRYEQLYYTGLFHERRVKAQLKAGRPAHMLRPLLEEAMRSFAEAEKIRPPENDDAILRWNRCARLLAGHSGFQAEPPPALFDAHDSPPV